MPQGGHGPGNVGDALWLQEVQLGARLGQQGGKDGRRVVVQPGGGGRRRGGSDEAQMILTDHDPHERSRPVILTYLMSHH